MASTDRILITSASAAKAAKGKLEEKKDSSGSTNFQVSDIHPKHWAKMTDDKKKEAEILVALKVEDKREKPKEEDDVKPKDDEEVKPK